MERLHCTDCGFELWRPIGRLEVSFLGLFDDGRWPGRCLLMLDEHAEHFEELDDDTAQRFHRDARRAGAAIRKLVGADRMNYALLGNTEPHVHWHLIPRWTNEPNPTRPPWEHPSRRMPLPPEEANLLIEDIRRNLDLRG